MKELTVNDLREIMRQCAGEDENVNLDVDISDTSFAELGYDSLALMETGAAVEKAYQVILPEEELATVDTPGAFVKLVNKLR